MLRTLTIACLLAAGSPALAQAPGEGVWRGVGMQAGKPGVQTTWTVRMTVKQGGRSEIEYPGLKCKGELRQVANGVQGFEFDEHITSGDCVDGGRIVAKQREGRVFWFWYLPGGRGPSDASAVLYRDEAIS